MWRLQFESIIALEPDMGVLAAGYNADALAEAKVYIAHLSVSRVTVALSFLPADWRAPGDGADPSSSGARAPAVRAEQHPLCSAVHGYYGGTPEHV